MKRLIYLLAAAAFASTFAACAARHQSDDAFVDAVHRLRPSVVMLSMKVPAENKHDKYDEAYATGFVVASGSWGSDILTVQHAIDGAWDLKLTVANRTKVPATVVAANSDLDIALVRTAKPNLPTVNLGTSEKLDTDVGREVGILGYPVPDEFDDEGLGLATSLNTGRLSAVRKDALEVTVSIVPGESGGPVFIANTGEIVGIAESRFESERSIGFALPIDDAKRFLHKTDASRGF
jgi:S1-C subfamily serine protease